jgi:glucose/mannose-6-phosphate isomerase
LAARKTAGGVDLDAPASFGRVDRQDILGRVERFAEDFEGAWKQARASAPAFRKGGRYVSSVVVAAMGGSAIAGEIAADAFRDALPVPMAVCQEYVLPAFARRETLVIVSSYSGGTEETLAMFDDARSRGCRIVGVTSGGVLGARLKEEGLPAFPLPTGIQPRAALPFLLAPVLAALERVELVSAAAAVDEAVSVTREVAKACGRARPTRANRAKKIAAALVGSTPAVYGQGVLRGAAMRWRTQLNENPKRLARDDVFPASNHNDINAWGSDPRAKDFQAVILRDAKEHPRVTRRIELTRRLAFKGNAGGVHEVEARGDSALARALSAVLVGDFVSVYLALKLGIDPSPVDVIVRLKDELAKPQ